MIKRIWTFAAIALTIALCVPFFSWALAACRPFPYSDEWHYLIPMTTDGAPTLKWLFEQHVDHRLPIQKLIHFFALHLSNFDFRSLDALNVIFSATASILFVLTARAYRGRSNVGDLFVPFSLLSLGAGYTQWGFELQFLATVVLFAAFLYCTVRGSTTLALLFLFLCSWTGLNGVLLSTFISAALFAFLLVARKNFGRSAAVAVILTLLQNMVLWIIWTPSAAADRHASVPALFKFAAGMTNGPMLVYAFRHPEWKLAILVALIGFGSLSAALVAWRKKTLPSFVVLASIVGTIVLTAATAYGRAKVMSWADGLEMHYGTLAMMMPIAAWIALSSAIPKRWSTAVGLVLVVLFAKAYWANYQWREGVVANDTQLNRAAQAAILSNAPASEVAVQRMSRFFYVDTSETRLAVTNGIDVLRHLRN